MILEENMAAECAICDVANNLAELYEFSEKTYKSFFAFRKRWSLLSTVVGDLSRQSYNHLSENENFMN